MKISNRIQSLLLIHNSFQQELYLLILVDQLLNLDCRWILVQYLYSRIELKLKSKVDIHFYEKNKQFCRTSAVDN